MKHLIILGDGMADHPIERLGGKTLLQYAQTPTMDHMAKEGRTGRLMTVPEGYIPGSEVANTAIMGYDLDQVYEGRGPLEAASIGYDMRPDDMAIRCNIITLRDGRILTHNGGNLETEDGDVLIKYLNEHLGNDRVQFITGIQYRHLLVIRGGNKHIVCAPPHDHPNEEWRPLLVKPEPGYTENDQNNTTGKSEIADTSSLTNQNSLAAPTRMTPQETADLLNDLIIRSQDLLQKHPFNIARRERGEREANSIWPWSGGYRPSMKTLMQLYPEVHSGSVISAVDLIRGIGHYAGLDIIKVPGATGLADTNYEGKTEAALKALQTQDFVFLHVEASDEAGHDGNMELKLKTIENLDKRMISTIYNKVKEWDEQIAIAVLPDHPTPVEIRTHVSEPVPFLIWYKGIEPDGVQQFDEQSTVTGAYGLLRLNQFMEEFMKF